MTELLVCGKLNSCPTYPYDDLTPELLDIIQPVRQVSALATHESRLRIAYVTLSIGNIAYWRELVTPLKAMGRKDLADVIEDKIRQYDRHALSATRPAGKEWRKPVKEFDQLFFKGTLAKIFRILKYGTQTPSP